eukprot:m.22706 g.22706  ORF g.22706 m.22706 type:complete len:325 (+) comp3791_c0_seq1:6249-7223(+)
MGADVRHAARADPRPSRADQRAAQPGGPPDDPSHPRLRGPDRHPERRGVRVRAGKHAGRRPRARAVAAERRCRGLAGPPPLLHALPRCHVDGRVRPGPGRPAPVEPDAGPQERRGHARRLRRLLRGRHAQAQVPREGPVPPYAHARRGHGGQRHRGQLPHHVRAHAADLAQERRQHCCRARGVCPRPPHRLVREAPQGRGCDRRLDRQVAEENLAPGSRRARHGQPRGAAEPPCAGCPGARAGQADGPRLRAGLRARGDADGPCAGRPPGRRRNGPRPPVPALHRLVSVLVVLGTCIYLSPLYILGPVNGCSPVHTLARLASKL